MQRNIQLTETLEQQPQGLFDLTIRISVFSLSHNLYYIFIYKQRPQHYIFHSRLGGSSCFLPGFGLTDRYFPNSKLSVLLWFSILGSPCSLFSYLIYLTCWQNSSYSMESHLQESYFFMTDQLTFFGVSWSHITILYS